MTHQNQPSNELSPNDSAVSQEAYALPERDSEPNAQITHHQESLERVGISLGRYLLKRHRDHGIQY